MRVARSAARKDRVSASNLMVVDWCSIAIAVFGCVCNEYVLNVIPCCYYYHSAVVNVLVPKIIKKFILTASSSDYGHGLHRQYSRLVIAMWLTILLPIQLIIDDNPSLLRYWVWIHHNIRSYSIPCNHRKPIMYRHSIPIKLIYNGDVTNVLVCPSKFTTVITIAADEITSALKM